jgi:putative restriction endonuclease
MKKDERAAQLWPLLALAARNQQILSHHMIERLTGIPRRAVGGLLAPIQAYCKKNKLPPLTSLVVGEEGGVPGKGFTGGGIEKLFEDQARVFVFDWLDHKVPFPKK